MTRFPPLAQTAQTQAERLVAQAASVPARPLDAASWDGLVARSALRGGEDRGRLVFGFGFAVAVGLGLVWLVTPARPQPPVANSGVQVVVSRGARWTQPSASTVVLSEGRLAMTQASDKPLRIETPHAVIEAQRSRFLAEVVKSGTFLSVEEGEVVLRAGSSSRVVHAGESLLWPPAPAIPVQLLVEPTPTEARCAGSPLGARRDCLVAEAATSSLDAQAALYELGVLEAKSGHSERAVEAWEQSLRRFPSGVLHPEVRLALLVELVRARRFSEAERVAEEFEVACADDGRRAEVSTLKALLSGH